MLKGGGADIFVLRIGPKSLIMGKLPMHVWKGRIEERINALILWCRPNDMACMMACWSANGMASIHVVILGVRGSCSGPRWFGCRRSIKARRFSKAASGEY
jgi:hypothetical protein